jgi:hypothetical protein
MSNQYFNSMIAKTFEAETGFVSGPSPRNSFMHAGNYFTVIVSHPALSLLAAAGDCIASEVQLEIGNTALCTVRVYRNRKSNREIAQRGSSFDFERMPMRYLHRSRAGEVGVEKSSASPRFHSTRGKLGIREVNVFNGSVTSHVHVAVSRNLMQVSGSMHGAEGK